MGEQQGLIFYLVLVCVCSSMTVTGASRQDLQMPLKITGDFCSWRDRYVTEPRHAVLKIAGVGDWELNELIYG